MHLGIQSASTAEPSRHPKSLDFENWQSLWGLLSLITIRKCGRHLEHFRAASRNVDNEASAVWTTGSRESFVLWEAIADVPSPSEAAILSETVQEILGQLDERTIFTLSLQGHTVAEISELISRSERTIERVLSRLRELLERRCEGDDS